MQLDNRIFGVWRQSLDRHQSIFALHNVSNETVEVSFATMNLIDDEDWVDLLSGDPVDTAQETLTLAPYQCCWITNRS